MRSGNPFFYDFSVIRTADHEDYLRSCFKHLRKRAGLHEKLMKELRREIRHNLVASGDLYVFDSPELKAARSLMEDLESNRPSIKEAVTLELRTKYLFDITPAGFSLKFHRVGEDQFQAETELSKMSRLSEVDAHTAIQDAILRLSSINQNIAYMLRNASPSHRELYSSPFASATAPMPLRRVRFWRGCRPPCRCAPLGDASPGAFRFGVDPLDCSPSKFH